MFRYFLYSNVSAFSRLGKSLEDSTCDLSGANLVGLFEARLEHQVHCVFPQDRRCDLGGQQFLDHFGVGVGLGIDVADDRNAGFLDFGFLQDALQRRNGGGHEFSVECSGNGQFDSHSGLEVGLGDLGNSVAGGTCTTDGVVTLAQKVGNLNLFAGLFAGSLAKLCNLCAVKTNDGNHTGVDGIGGSLHSFSTSLGDFHTIGERNGSGKAQCRVFTQGESHRACGFLDGIFAGFLLQLFDGGHACYKDGRLRDNGRIELFLGTFGADFQQIVSKDLTGFVEEGLGGRDIIDDLTAHTNRLCALSWEHESDLGRKIVKVIVAGRDLCHGTTEGLGPGDKGRRQPSCSSQKDHCVSEKLDHLCIFDKTTSSN
mmetsp:Transcript_20939/g.51937  ORF Transcript_20939/g.51937 Transcript_20939/m.51937 type:complete len:370 (-) Transcript_20939:25-1134(-)